jgi:hypothetical protein
MPARPATSPYARCPATAGPIGPTIVEAGSFHECAAKIMKILSTAVIELAAHRRDRLLVDAGILTREQRGKWAYYRLAPEVLNALAALITTPTV